MIVTEIAHATVGVFDAGDVRIGVIRGGGRAEAVRLGEWQATGGPLPVFALAALACTLATANESK